MISHTSASLQEILLHRIVPDFIIEEYRAGRLGGVFEAASLFIDISGFSVMTDALMGRGRDGAETLAVIMGQVFDPLVESIFAQGGMIVGYAGDSINALFAVQSDEQGAARRALCAACSIREQLRVKPTFETRYGSFRISAKVGLALGSVSWGILRSRAADRAVYYFRGQAVDEAARAEQQATTGEVVLTEAMRQRSDIRMETKRLGGFHSLLQVLDDLPAARPVALPPVDAAAAALFASPDIITQDLQGEFRQTVHLFVRLPDLADDRLEQFMHTFFDLQARYGGLIDRIDFGDKGCNMIVVWGTPIAHENDIDRALNFILDLRVEVGFPVTAGITYYTSYAGYIGAHLFETYTAYGWGISMAARFMADAAKGEIWLDERIAQRVKERFDLDFVGKRSFKGFADIQSVYGLRGRKSSGEPAFTGRMVGRESELEALVAFVEPLWQGRPAGVVGIWGEAGMGKSRLVHEFRQALAVQGRNSLWAMCQADEILRRSFNPFRYWLFQYFGLVPGEAPGYRLQKFMTKTDELIAASSSTSLASDLKQARPFLAALVEVAWPDTLYEQMDAQGRYDNTILGLVSLFKAESRRQPVIVFMEDAHYLDEDSRTFVPRLKRALSAEAMPCPIAILMTTRWEGTKVLLEDSLVDLDIDLKALTDESVAAVASDVLGGPAASPLVGLINERAEGNPFHVEQFARYLYEQELLQRNAGGEWSLAPGKTRPALPADTRAMLVARLDKLPGPVKEAVQSASVLGRVFDVPVLQHMVGGRPSLQNEIVAAERAAILSPLSDTRYIFKHDLLRDVAYSMQLQSRREQLHGLAFQALRELFGEDKHRHNGALAYHSEQAGLVQEAHHYLVLAGDAARDGYHIGQALDFYRRALAILPQTDSVEQYLLHLECARLLADHGTPEERTREIDALQALADAIGEPGNLSEVTLLRARLSSSSGAHEKSAELARAAQELALKAGRYDIAISASRSLLDSYYQRGMYEKSVEQGEAGIALAREHKELQEEAFILNALGMVFLEIKNPSAARSYFERSQSIFRDSHNVRGVALATNNLGSVAGYQGNYDTALYYYEESLRLAREFGSRQVECRLLGNMGWVCGLLGDYEKAEAYERSALQIAREIGDRGQETISFINLSSHAGAMGDSSSAVGYAEKGIALARRSSDRNAEAWALTYLGHALFDSGSLDASSKAYKDALDIRNELHQAALGTEPSAGLGRIALLQNDLASARRHADAIMTQLEQDGTLEGTDQPFRVYLSCYLVLSAAGDPRAGLILSSARDMLKTRADRIADPAARQVFLEKIPHNREILSLWEKRRST